METAVKLKEIRKSKNLSSFKVARETTPKIPNNNLLNYSFKLSFSNKTYKIFLRSVIMCASQVIPTFTSASSFL